MNARQPKARAERGAPASTVTPAEFALLLGTCGSFNMRKATRVVTQFFDDKLAAAGLRSTQLVVLVALALRGPLSMSALAETLVLDPSTLSRNLKPLERAGLVAIRAGKARRRLASLSPEGLAAIERAYPAWAEAQTTFLAGVGPDNWTRLVGLLSDVADHRRGRG